MSEIQKISADSNEYMGEIVATEVSVALSYAVFNRADWAIMLSCFACLWSEVVTKILDEGVCRLYDLLKLLRSGGLSSFVAEYTQTHGFAPHPVVLINDYLSSHPLPSKKRRADSKVATKGRLSKKSRRITSN